MLKVKNAIVDSLKFFLWTCINMLTHSYTPTQLYKCSKWNRFICESLFFISFHSSFTSLPLSTHSFSLVRWKLIDAGKLFQFAFIHRHTYFLLSSFSLKLNYILHHLLNQQQKQHSMVTIVEWSKISNLLRTELWMKQHWKNNHGSGNWNQFIFESEKINCAMKLVVVGATAAPTVVIAVYNLKLMHSAFILLSILVHYANTWCDLSKSMPLPYSLVHTFLQSSGDN